MGQTPRRWNVEGAGSGPAPRGHLVACDWEASPARLGAELLGGTREVLGKRDWEGEVSLLGCSRDRLPKTASDSKTNRL